MEVKPMKIMIIEDDIDDCNKLKAAAKGREDIEIIGITDSDIKALKIIKEKRPEGIILDLELNNSSSGNVDTFDFMKKLKSQNLNYNPIVIVATHVNSKITYEKLHRDGVELIQYKDQPNFSYENILNKFIGLRQDTIDLKSTSIEEELENQDMKISDYINHELELIGISPKMIGRQYLYDAILFLIEQPDSELSVNQYLTKLHKKAPTTIATGMQNAINKAWRNMAIEDLEENYTARINVNTGIPTPAEFVCYYRDKIKKLIQKA